MPWPIFYAFGGDLMSLDSYFASELTYEGSCDPVFEDVSVQLDTNWSKAGVPWDATEGERTTLLRPWMGEGSVYRNDLCTRRVRLFPL